MKKRRRTVRRSIERELEKIGDKREKLAALSEGGAPDRPIEISSASVAEGAAKSMKCARCEGELGELEHDAVRGPTGAILRRIRARCRMCGHKREIWMRVVEQRPS